MQINYEFPAGGDDICRFADELERQTAAGAVTHKGKVTVRHPLESARAGDGGKSPRLILIQQRELQDRYPGIYRAVGPKIVQARMNKRVLEQVPTLGESREIVISELAIESRGGKTFFILRPSEEMPTLMAERDETRAALDSFAALYKVPSHAEWNKTTIPEVTIGSIALGMRTQYPRLRDVSEITHDIFDDLAHSPDEPLTMLLQPAIASFVSA